MGKTHYKIEKNGKFDEEGIIRYYKDGKLHRIDGPAEIFPNNGKSAVFYFLEGQIFKRTVWEEKVLNYKLQKIKDL